MTSSGWLFVWLVNHPHSSSSSSSSTTAISRHSGWPAMVPDPVGRLVRVVLCVLGPNGMGRHPARRRPFRTVEVRPGTGRGAACAADAKTTVSTPGKEVVVSRLDAGTSSKVCMRLRTMVTVAVVAVHGWHGVSITTSTSTTTNNNNKKG